MVPGLMPWWSETLKLTPDVRPLSRYGNGGCAGECARLGEKDAPKHCC